MIVWLWLSKNWCHFNMSWLLRLKMQVFGWKNSTPLWIALKRVNVHHLNTPLMPTSPLFFFLLPLPLPPPTPPPPLSATALSLSDLIALLSDFIWPLPANQRPTSGWSPWQPTEPNILGLKRWAAVCWGGKQWQIFPGLTAVMEQSRTEAEMTVGVFLHACGCVCVTSFPLSPLPIPWTQSSGKGWSGGLFVSLYICVGEGVEEHIGSSRQP